MGAYQLLFSITVEHMYFANLACKSLEFVPTQTTAHILNKSGLLLKTSGNCLSVFFEHDRLDILRMFAQDDLAFTFKVYSKDPNFPRYTVPAIWQQNSILYFDNQHLVRDTAGRLMLHGDPVVSERNYVDLNTDLIANILDPRDKHVRPAFIMNIKIPENTQLLSLDRDSVLRSFFISFASNQTFWKYYLMGDLSRHSVYITDLDNEIQFKEVGNAVFPGNRMARMLLSTHAIRMHERPLQRLQLKELLDFSDKILIKRLPNASISQIHGEMVDGRMENISEIYVH